MPDLTGTSSPFGFQPWGNVLRQRLYAIATAPVIAFYHQDLVAVEGLAIATPHGALLGLEEDATPSAGNTPLWVGSVLSLFDSDFDPVMYIAATTTGNGTIAGYAMVADHPMQEFLVQEDGDTSSLVLASIGENIDLIATTAGSTMTGLSGHMIDSDTLGSTSVSQDIRIHNSHPEDTINATNTAGRYGRFIVTINAHFWDSNLAGT